MIAERTGTQENVLAGLIDQGMPVIVLAPHLGDAALSCGALMAYAVSRTQVTVVTFFTEGGQAPFTRPARRYLRQSGVGDAEAVYQRRRAEDRAALEPLGITCAHAGLTEAPFRRPAGQRGSRLGHLLPGLAHRYPSFLAWTDAGPLRDVRENIHRVAGSGLNLVLAPLAVGGHVDHVLVRTAAQGSGAPVAYYSDFPHDRRASASEAFTYRHGLAETRWPEPAAAKAALIGAYQSQLRTPCRGADLPLAPEVFFSAGQPCAAASSAWWR